PSEHADQRSQRVVALNLRRYSRASGGARMAAPRDRAYPEARRRRAALEPCDQSELIVCRRERRSEVLESTGGDIVERAHLEQRASGGENPDDEQRHRECERRAIRAAPLVPPHRDRRRNERTGAVAGDEKRSHVAGDHLHTDQHQHDTQQRPKITAERAERAAAPRTPPGHRTPPRKKKPRSA